MGRTWRRCKLLGNSHAEVYLAADKLTGCLFVVKTTDTGNSQSTAELLNEITIFLMLDSPRIVQYLGSSFTEEGDKTRLNLFVEYMPGGTLRDHIARLGAPLTELLIRTYTRSILEALHHMHTQGIVHGDVKSDNILVGLYEVKLADFGGSKLVGVRKSMKGTCAWMAPEVVAGVEQGPPSDIWSLGCTIIEMATGADPWPELPHTDLLRQVIQFSGLTPSIPLSLSLECQDFLEKCLVRDPTKRWTTEQLLEDRFLRIRMPSPMSCVIPPTCTSIAKHPRGCSAASRKRGGNLTEESHSHNELGRIGKTLIGAVPRRGSVPDGNVRLRCRERSPSAGNEVLSARSTPHYCSDATSASYYSLHGATSTSPMLALSTGYSRPHSTIPVQNTRDLSSMMSLELTESEKETVNQTLLQLTREPE